MKPITGLLAASIVMLLPSFALAQSSTEAMLLERLSQLEDRQAAFEKQLAERDKRIADLEARLAEREGDEQTADVLPMPASTPSAMPQAEDELAVARDDTSAPDAVAKTAASGDQIAMARASKEITDPFGEFAPGKGFTVARTDYGELQLSLYTYLRYLNQSGLDNDYVDHFGNRQEIDKRQDFQVNKVFLYTKGWLFEPDFRYLFYVWSTNTALGSTSNNLVAGNLSYRFSDAFTLTGGVVGMPSTRSMMGQFPYWHRVDARLIADEFMRGSFTQGVAATGKITDELHYNLTLGNNLNNFGVSASKLDNDLETIGGALLWMPTTGEFGPRASIGDYEYHEQLATLFGLHATFSTEDKQSQPGTEDPENTQIRLSDGITVFTPDALAPGVTVDRLDYQLLALNAAMKYRGFYLEGEAYYRMLDSFDTQQPLAIDNIEDYGVQLKASTMLVPKTWQAYANSSKIFGEYGDAWDAGVGLNWWPYRQRGLRFNSEAIYLNKSPVGYNSVPYPLGGNGWVFVTNAELAF